MGFILDNRRSFTSIDNLCFVIDRLISENSRPGVYHIADDESLSTNELIKVICETMGRKARIWYLPKKLMNGIAGIKRMPVSAKEGLRRTIKSFQK